MARIGGYLVNNLRVRILDALSDDEEFLEEIYLLVNFDLQEVRRNSQNVRCYIQYPKTYRLWEIVAELSAMKADGLVADHHQSGFPSGTDSVSALYSLTEVGQTIWTRDVKEMADEELFGISLE